MSLPRGTRLGPYQVGEPIGAGGMGEVYRARDTRLDRSVAIKVLSTHLSSLSELRERFDREARAISSLNHPHICALYDIGSQDGVDFLVMELLEGQTLADRLACSVRPASGSTTVASSRGLKLHEALVIAQQIADALDTAHRQGVVHRDLKPGNIMLTASGAKLLDFGLAKQAQSALSMATPTIAPTSPQPLTAEGTLLGTLQYMAPEQLEGREADARTDVFAFGAVLYEMVTGRRAFEGKTQVGVIAAIVDLDPPPVSSLAPVSPKQLDLLVKSCLAKSPDKRWQSIADVSLQLRTIADSLGEVDAGPVTGTFTRQLRRARLTSAAVAALLVAGAAAATAWWLTPAATDPLRLVFELPTPRPAAPMHVAVSPRGTHVVTLSASGGNTLWVGSLERGTGQVVPGTEDAAYPCWSADGRFIAFFAGGKLKKVDLAGTPPQTLADAPAGVGGTWNHDDVIVFAPDANGPLVRVSAAGGEPAPLTQLDKSRGETAHRHPWFLPDGRHFIYVAVTEPPDQSGIMLASLDSPERRLLVKSRVRSAFASPDRLLFMRDNTLMAQPFDPKKLELAGDPYPVAEDVGTNAFNSLAGFSVSSNGVLVYRPRGAAGGNTALRWFDRQGASTTAFEAIGDFADPALSPDQQRIVVGRTPAGASSDLWLFDLKRGASTRFTFDAAPDQSAVWSPDGAGVVFRSSRESGIFNLYRKRANGIEPEQVLHKSDRPKSAFGFSRDGRFLLYEEFADLRTGTDLWVLPLTGDQKPQPVVRSTFRDVDGRFSPDGRWIAYASNESGRFEVSVLSFPDTSIRIPISTAGGSRPMWRDDGKELFFTGEGPPNAMMAVEIAVSSDGVLNAGLPRKLFETPIFGRYDVTPDGRRFLINTPVQTTTVAETPVVKVIVNGLRATP